MEEQIQEKKEKELEDEKPQQSAGFVDEDVLAPENINRIIEFPTRLDSNPLAFNTLNELFEGNTDIVIQGSYRKSVRVKSSGKNDVDIVAAMSPLSKEDQEPNLIFLNQPANSVILVGIDIYDEKNQKPGDESEKKSFRLVLFLAGLTYPADLREDMLGHLIERYNKQKETVGAKYAQLWILRDVSASVLPVVYEIMRSKTVITLKRIGLEVVLKYFLG